MWRLTGQFDPVTGARIDARLRAALTAVEAAGAPADAPDDPLERHSFLRADALAALVNGDGPRGGPAELVIVLDTTAVDADGHPVVDWAIPVEIPASVLADLYDHGELYRLVPVIVRARVVLHAPGTLDLGHTTRLANRDQRRALRALYPTCAMPGCAVRFGDCAIHHVIWWEPPHNGPTDLDNLVQSQCVCTPTCTRSPGCAWSAGFLASIAMPTGGFCDGATWPTGGGPSTMAWLCSTVEQSR